MIGGQFRGELIILAKSSLRSLIVLCDHPGPAFIPLHSFCRLCTLS